MKTAVVPAHNEEHAIGSLLLDLRDYVDTTIVVDDGSTDRTAEIASNVADVVCHDTNCGKGAAIRTGLGEALERGADAIILIDGPW